MEIPLYSSTIRRREMDAVLTCMVSEKIGPGEINRKFSQAAKEFFNVLCGHVAIELFHATNLALRFQIPRFGGADGR